MSALQFLRTQTVSDLLQRAARSAGVPLALHYVERNQEGTKIYNNGKCQACQHVSTLPNGNRACRQSRVTAASMALRQNRPMTFLCHMGFACISVPIPNCPGFLLTFGPYVPAEEHRSLEHDALQGLQYLLDDDENLPLEGTFPVSLDDIHRTPADCVPTIAEWTAETLDDLWQKAEREVENEDAEVITEDDPTPATKRRNTQKIVPYAATDIAAALLGGNQPQARQLMQNNLAESQTSPRTKVALRRARTIAALAATLEAVEASGADVPGVWNAFPSCIDEIQHAENDQQLLDAAMRLLGRIKRLAEKEAKTAPDNKTAPTASYAKLNAILQLRLTEHITLHEVAQLLGETPSAISHRLKRKFGMNYSEYLGRLRIDKAKEILRRTKLSATEVAHRVGFSDQSNFTKQFKKFEGNTPIDYRKKLAKGTKQFAKGTKRPS